MSQLVRLYLIASAALCALGVIVHLAAIPLGAEWAAFIGAPRGLLPMLERGSVRPALTCILISSVLAIWSMYGLSAAGLLARLPALRLVLALSGGTLILRAFVLPVVAVWEPDALSDICGRCQQFNGFVLFTSLLCLFIGGGYALAALQLRPNLRSGGEI
ncbi:MAG: hypothetical protein V4582_25500 [Pseudomonadota bacterium]